MFPQAFPCPQIRINEITTGFDDPATNFLVPTVYDDHVLMGNIAYDFLVRETNSIQHSYDFFGYLSLPQGAHGTVNYPIFSPTSPDYITSPTNTSNSPLFSPSPSPSLSQSSYTTECDQSSPEPSPAPKTSCGQATPMFNHIKKKWSCSICEKCFRGKWECKRHIGVVGKRAKCLLCEGVFSWRGDSLRRHFTKYCKGNARNVQFEDAFVGV